MAALRDHVPAAGGEERKSSSPSNPQPTLFAERGTKRPCDDLSCRSSTRNPSSRNSREHRY